MKKGVKALIVVIVVLAALVGAALFVLPRFFPDFPGIADLSLPRLGLPGGAAAPPGEPSEAFAVPVAVQAAGSGPARESLVLYGSVFAQKEVSIVPTVNGKVKAIRVEQGDAVQRGQVLAEIDRDQPGLTFAAAEVTSAIGGVVKSVLTQVGATVSPAMPLFQIVDMDVVEVVVSVPERMIARVRVGQPVEVTVVAYPGRVFTGSVSRTSPVVDPASRTLETRIRVPNPGYLLKPGMFAESRLILRQERDIVQVPLSALVDKAFGRVMFVVEDGAARQVAPEVAFVEGETAALSSGVAAGQRVVVVGQQNLNDGDPVTVAEERK